MNKVLHIITGLGAGGAQSCLLSIIKNKSCNIQHSVISLGRGNIYKERIKSHADTYYECPIDINSKLFFQIFRLYKIIKYSSPDIIQTWLYHSDLIVTLIYIFLKNKPKLVWNIRCSDMAGRYDRGKNFILLKILSLLSFLPNKIIYNSKAGILSHEIRGYKKSKSILIYNGVNTKTFQKIDKKKYKNKLGINNKITLFGLIARNDPIKGHLDFLKAISIVPDCHGIIVGSGITKSNEILDQIRDLNIKSKISLFEQKENIETIIPSLDFLVSASYSEGFPTVIAEAMSSEVPVIATNVGDTELLLGGLGFITSPQNYLDLSKKMVLSQEMSQIKIEKLGKDLRTRIINNFSSEIMTNKYHNLYISLCSDTSSKT
ncbi:MAG: hypothetical protein CFH01_00547 [Alphaproteobacteria bacterium MarineAlpha2_Bin1]|nr:MAG: hypothetical protein CFH01_00547 [Alphaproteobacteria bacterium MarineAlpha2_Bin1]